MGTQDFMLPLTRSNRYLTCKPAQDTKLIVVAAAQKVAAIASPTLLSAPTTPTVAPLDSSALLPIDRFRGGITVSRYERYVGQLLDQKPHGYGVFTSTDPAAMLIKYEGGWKLGKKSGKGTADYLEGTYIGGFEADVMHGQGRWESRDGIILHGTFRQGSLFDGIETRNQVTTKIESGKAKPGLCCTIL